MPRTMIFVRYFSVMFQQVTMRMLFDTRLRLLIGNIQIMFR